MVSISRSAHLQGSQWVDVSGWSDGSEDKGEVCADYHRKVVVRTHHYTRSTVQSNRSALFNVVPLYSMAVSTPTE